jgi:hypothetical protein
LYVYFVTIDKRLLLQLLTARAAVITRSARRIGPGSASHYEIQQQQQQESAKMNIVLAEYSRI